jgi:hypothetical protein
MQNEVMEKARIQLCTAIVAGLLATGSLQAETKVVLKDDRDNRPAVTYTLPNGWAGAGNVTWNTEAAHDGTLCVRTMQFINPKDDVTVNYISAYEAPLRRKNPNAMQLAELLLPAVRQMPGCAQAVLNDATLYSVPQDLADFRMGRDRLSRKLGKKVEGKVYAVAAVCSDGTTVGAIVYERNERKFLSSNRTVTFHDICIMHADAKVAAKAYTEVKTAAHYADYDNAWVESHIRKTASSIDGMPKLDEQALPAITDKAEQRLKLGLPTVLDCMYSSFSKRYVRTMSAGNSVTERP